MPIINRQDATEVEGHIQRIFAAPSSGRAAELTALFVEKMDFARASGSVSLAGAPSAVVLPDRAERVAVMDGLNVVYVALDIEGVKRVRKGEAAEAAKLISDQLGDDMLLVMTNTRGSQLHFIYPTFEGSKPYLRRMVIEQGLSRRTSVEQLSKIYWNWSDTGSIRQAVEQVFDVEAVTARFFKKYKDIFEFVVNSVSGFDKNYDDNRKLFVQTLFNRLMFVYFLSRKGWLTFKGKPDYLNALWDDYPAQSEDRNFYTNRLRLLFFSGLNNPECRDLMRNNPALHALIGDVQFLNGGVFEELKLDRRSGVLVPDDCIDAILHELFDQFNFTVMESTPLDVEVAVDPEMLGKVFEELVTGRHETGSYYTPRPIVAFMSREALKTYLEGEVRDLDKESTRRFVDERDVSNLSLGIAHAVQGALERVTILDPACGSGAYLVGMMQELIDLETALYSDRLLRDPKSLYQLKLRIIEQNLYGADVDDFAVNIAMLRLWLSLAIDFEGARPESLPNLDFKIVFGDSLTSPDPSPVHQLRLFVDKAHGLREKLREAKAGYMTAIGAYKLSLRQEIEAIESELSDALDDRASGDRSVEWRVQFAEVFDRREGFDIVIANPPYRRQEGLASRKKDLERLYAEVYTSAADYHVYFYNRSVQLLRQGGALAVITSNKYMRAEYGEKIREYLPKSLTLSQVVDFGDLPVFTAASYPAILVGRKHPAQDDHDLQVADLAVPVRRAMRDEGLAVTRETVTRAMDRLPQFLALSGVTHYPQVLLRKEGWILEDTKLVRLFDRLMSHGAPLSECVSGRMYRGILTGLNEAFEVGEVERQELADADPGSADVIRPWLRGRDIDRWRVRPSGKYLIAIPNSDDAAAGNPWGHASSEREARRIFGETYPAIHEHLSKFEEYEKVTRSGRTKKVGLRIRQDRGRWWWELRSCAYYHEFAKPKIVWPRNTEPAGMQFAFDITGTYLNDKAYMIPEPPLWLLALLNSSLYHFLAAQLTTKLRGGWLELKSDSVVGRLPVPDLSAENRAQLSDFAASVLDSHLSRGLDDLDDLVAFQFGLSPSDQELLRRWRQLRIMATNDSGQP